MLTQSLLRGGVRKARAVKAKAMSSQSFSSLLYDYANIREFRRKLPHQGDSVEGELPTVWCALNSDGGIPSNVSWGRSSLYSRIHSALISRT